MKCKTLINIIGKYNHYNILAAMNLRPEKVVFIRLPDQVENLENTMLCLQQKLQGITFVEHVIQKQCSSEISQVVSKYNSEDTYLNLSGGTKLMSLLAFQAAIGSKLHLIYVDNDTGKILSIKDQVEELMPLTMELTVEDIVCSTGAEILKHSTESYAKKEFRELVSYMIANYDMWKIVKDILRNTHIIRQFELQPLYIELSTTKLSYVQLKALRWFFKELKAKQLITEYEYAFDHIEFTFANREVKSFIMTAGSWLEALTYRCFKELKEVTNVISGMLFVWDEMIRVQNELDVVASVDSNLICISCKDTCKYDVDDLNELEVYADHLGGRKVVKILVSTQPPERGNMIYQRAEEMGVHIVLFNGDVNSFRDKLHRILME